MDNQLGPIVFSEEELQQRVRQLARQIETDYAGQTLYLVAVLRGALPFLADLARAIGPGVDVCIDYLSVCHGPGGKVQILKDLDAPMSGKRVLVVEDIVNEGNTLRYVLDLMRLREPASLKVCAMFVRHAALAQQVSIDYVGLSAPAAYLVGYGLDHEQRYRNLPYVAELKG